MKKVLLLPVVFLLASCAQFEKLYDSYMLAPYDNVEYSLVNKIRTQAEITIDKCESRQEVLQDLKVMSATSRELKNFSQYIPDNKDTVKITVALHTMVDNTYEYYVKNQTINTTYCKLKIKQIISSADTAQKAIGARPR